MLFFANTVRKNTQLLTSGCAPDMLKLENSSSPKARDTDEPRKLASVTDLYFYTLKHAISGSLYPEVGKCGGGPGGCSMGSLQPFSASERQRGNDWPPVGHTMVGHLRLDNVRMAVESVVKMNIPGDFVELGVWRGGVCVFARAILNTLEQSNRKVVLFDAFDSIQGYGEAQSFLSVSQDQVRATFERYNLMNVDTVKFVKGLFAHTVGKYAREHKFDKISVLRIDGNFYGSYQEAMYHLYERVPLGGYIIFDDVLSHPGVMDFWNDFKREQGLVEELIAIDDHSTWFRKTKDITVDWIHYRNDTVTV